MSYLDYSRPPRDNLGVLTDLTKPLLDAMNHAAVDEMKFNALHALLTWATATLSGEVAKDFESRKKRVPSALSVPAEAPASVVAASKPAAGTKAPVKKTNAPKAPVA